MRLSLDRVKKGQHIVIRSIPNEMVRAQAIRFGISEGAEVVCQEIIPAGPVVIRKNKQEIAIGRNLARQIGVELVG
ncbi:ferrous iron transport protein A [Heliobacillus mobilis]|uniref:Ferrous iron transport protein A n=2 Tax=Heliobacterium TaxID=2697 RepID=A0A6I3SNW4_HELMO|nr:MULTISPECIES: ferrous iron transport protein A [Heliobacterium]MBC9785566.1 ferrous iron transport protein A [Heliobacterium chlorum]MTV50721.1 ferrous iron transport protein A [Heliobacterium mobile]